MKKVFKTLFFLGGTVAAGYMGIKIYRTVKELEKLEKALPDYIAGVCGETPAVKCIVQMTTNLTATVVITLTAETLAKYGDLSDLVQDFIREYHPELLKRKIVVKLKEKTPDTDTHTSGAHYTDPDEG